MMTTRFQDEEERALSTYEDIDVVLSCMNSNDGCNNDEHVEMLGELLMNLTGVNQDVGFDSDKATIGRLAARQWLHARRYITT
jgi:hypothetical protein